LKWETNSAAGAFHADSYEGKYLRGYMDNPAAELSSEKEILSEGSRLYVTRYSLLKMPYTSTVVLKECTVEECLTEYLNQSDQTLSFVKMETKSDSDGKLLRVCALLSQLMPGGSEEEFKKFYTSEGWPLLEKEGEPEDKLSAMEFGILGTSPISFRCTCSEERIKNALLGLPEAEKQDLLKDESIEISCHYCGRRFQISRDTLSHWFQEHKGGIQ